MRAVLNYARLSDADAARLGGALREAGIEVVATTSYRKEDPQRFGPAVRPYWWRDYRPESVGEPWDDLRPEAILSAEEILALLPATERPGPHVGGSIEAYWRLRGEVVRAHRVLDEARPDVVLSIDHPENSLDYLIMRIADQRGIPVLLGRLGIAPGSRVVMTDAFGPALLPDGRLSPAVIPCTEDSRLEQDARAAALAVIEARLRGEDLWRWGGDSDPDIATESPVGHVARRVMPRSRRLRSRRVERPMVTGRRFLARLAGDLEASSSSAAPEAGRDDCVLFLHYQPEMTTLTLGGWSVNQLEAAKVVADGLPEGWRLFVREHPMTLSSSRSRTSASFRPPGFYARVAAMPRTELLSLREPAPIDLRRTRLVVTSTGTVGLEALAVGVPVLHLGNAPYRNFVGTHWLASPASSQVGDATRRLVGMPSSAIVDGFRRSSYLLESVSFHGEGGAFTSEAAAVLARGVRAWRR